MTALLWLRRDLRRGDLPALLSAHESAAGDVLPVFVVDERLWQAGGHVRRAWLAANLRALEASYDGHLTVLRGDPREVIPDVARRVGARTVHISGESTPAGMGRDEAVSSALRGDGLELVTTGSPYAVGPGRVLNHQGDGYRVFTPYARAWREVGWPAPAPDVDASFGSLPSDERALAALDEALDRDDLPRLPEPGEHAALERWAEFLDGSLEDYAAGRDLPAVDGTSFMSPYLKVGAVHPRTLLATVQGRDGAGAERLITELAWREFYADVLWRVPGSAWRDLRDELRAIPYDRDDELVDAWRYGRTGYPFVDAGMRQLAATGWMHNRVRMVTASFLTKDLHVWWPVGARWFLDHLIDGDLASNSHGWQWVAGTGTDAAPYFRIFNPVTQGKRFDPTGDYVRRWVPELAHLAGVKVHEPWKHAEGYAHGYPEPVIDHAEERRVALARYEQARGAR